MTHRDIGFRREKISGTFISVRKDASQKGIEFSNELLPVEVRKDNLKGIRFWRR
jgi:hypothetical protein